MLGSIRCIRCNSSISTHGNGVCPKCKHSRGYSVNVFWARKRGGDSKHYDLRLGLDWPNTLAKLWEMRTAIRKGTFNPSEYRTGATNPNRFVVRFEEWLDAREADNLAPATLELYRYHTKRMVEHMGDEDVAKIDYESLDDMFKSLVMTGGSKRTMRAILHVFFVWLRRKKIIASVPPFPTVSAKGARQKYVLTVEQQEQAISRLPETLQDVFRLMTYVGARVSEILTLKISDVDMEKEEITIRRTWSARQIKESTKTDSPRTFPLYGGGLDVIRRNLKGRIGDVYLFAQANSRPYSYSYILWAWRKFSGLKIPLKDATRRSWATNMRNAGVSMNAIQRGLGHRTIKTTELYLDSDVTWAKVEFERADKVLRFPTAKLILNRNEG